MAAARISLASDGLSSDPLGHPPEGEHKTTKYSASDREVYASPPPGLGGSGSAGRRGTEQIVAF